MGEYMLAVFRILVGWIFLWPFFDKLFGLGFQTPAGNGFADGVSPSSFVTFVTDGIFAGFYSSIGGNLFVDILMMAALIGVGVTLMLGFASKVSTVSAIAFLVVMYTLCVPPTDNPIIDYHIILCFGLLATLFLGGFDRLSVNEKWKSLWIVKRYPILG
jgi:thiosulfate dehydrogenase [quinone] large subunit